ncbi:MAG TPA: glycosyltransferase family 39 protein [Acidimicrobiales bacterium]|nr:glycosyltransferase family 39 protein [Acidimicrobiales bacterium]
MDLTYRGTGQDRPGQAQEDGAPPVVAEPRPRPPTSSSWSSSWSKARAGIVAFLVVAVALRFFSLSHLWLDEALSVNIARLPLRELPEALRHDGAPPLYYVLLHAWIRLFGDSILSVRALSGLFGVAAVPLTWLAGRRLAGPRVAWAATVLMAASPFAVRYSTEARMYSLMMVLVLVGYLAVADLLEGGGARPAVVLAGVTAAALLSHYWAFYLLAVAAAALAFVARRGDQPARDGARRALIALGAGCALFLPWAPSFLYQLRHTGTPWGRPGQFRSFFDTVTHFAGGYWNAGIPLGLLYFGLVVLAVFGSPVDSRRILLELRPRPPGRGLAAVTFGTLAVAILAGWLGRSAFAVRYAAVLFPFVVLLVALGTDVFVHPRAHAGVLAVAAVLGLWGCVPNAVGDRTAAAKVASALERSARPGDVVVYCPDQLGPSVSRELDAPGLVQITFPRGTGPERVDWVDYGRVNKAARTRDFAPMVLDRAGPDHDVWVVWAPGYRTFGTKCQNLVERLEDARPDNRRVVKVSTKYFERPGLVRFRPGPA